MAFTLAAIVGSTTVTLSDGNPFSLIRATGMGGASVRRVTAQGPSQHGDTDLGYRLSPRDVELVIGFRGTSDSALDAHRDTLTSIFKPLSSTPVKLRVTRDDGGVRQLDGYVVGTLDINLVPDHRPGHYHQATVRLRAADPAWYEVAPGTVTTGTVDTSQIWYYAGGAIGTAQVLDFGSFPTQGEAWAYTGTIPGTQGWAIAVRTGRVNASDNPIAPSQYPYQAGDVWWRVHTEFSGTIAIDARWETNAPGYFNNTLQLHDFMVVGTSNYIQNYTPDGSDSRVVMWGANKEYAVSVDGTIPIAGTARRWRSDSAGGTASYWPEDIELYAIYSPELSESQRDALFVSMDNAYSGSVTASLAIPYNGDLPEYPVISVSGPVTGLEITNSATGETLDFGTITIGAGTTYVIDTRYGYKTVLAGTVNKRGDLTADSDLAEWHLAPDPVATGGTNIITVYGTGPTEDTQVEIVYYNRYSGF